MKGNPKMVGETAAFDWKKMDEALSGSASRNCHAVWRIILDFPGVSLYVPKYLVDAGVEFRSYDGKRSPYYGDPKLLEAIEQFIKSSAKRYDGDKRLGFMQAGLLGFWGEWHTYGYAFIPAGVGDMVVGWFAASYTKTRVQLRYPSASAYAAGFGLHDDSFAHSTLDGAANGGTAVSYFFWPSAVQKGQSDFWKRGVMGGETRPAIQGEVFDPTYARRTSFKQDFMECVQTTHATYIFHHAAFKNGGFSGIELANARHVHARMGYNFYISSISVKTSATAGQVDVDVSLAQIGVAPFYYDLRLALSCPGMSKKFVGGVEKTLIELESSAVYGFTGIPVNMTCLNAVAFTLESSYSYSGRPIKFAQGSNGLVVVSLPRPPLTTPIRPPFPAPVPPPFASPVRPPFPRPFSPPVASPVRPPLSAPMPPPVASSSTGRMTLVLVNTSTNAEVGIFKNGTTLELCKLPSINVRADPSSSIPVQSVQFLYDGINFNMENVAPFSFNGDSGSVLLPWTPSLGMHSIVAIPYSSPNAQGIMGPRTAVSFDVVQCATMLDLVLMNDGTGSAIQPLISGSTVRLSSLPTRNLNIYAITNPANLTTGGVRFAYNGNTNFRSEWQAPYAFAISGSWTLTTGTHNVTATVINNAGTSTGFNEGSRFVSFKVVA